ncbi:MAG: hypothetical protein ACYSU4_21640, partial [Planctomycetota bacterium]
KIFPKFLSPSINTTYEQHAKKNSRIFGSKLHTRLIIEAGFFPLPPHLEYLVFCGGLKNNMKLELSTLPILSK